jgi:flagellar protein FlbT
MSMLATSQPESLVPTTESLLSDCADGRLPGGPRILQINEVDTPVKQLYFCVQRMWLEDDLRRYQGVYFELIGMLLAAVPTTRPLIESASIHLIGADYPSALVDLEQLVEYEAAGFGAGPGFEAWRRHRDPAAPATAGFHSALDC